LLLPSPNVSQAFQFRPCKNFLVAYAYAISSKTQKLSVQPIIITHTSKHVYGQYKSWHLYVTLKSDTYNQHRTFTIKNYERIYMKTSRILV
jgi:hypothetical protein